MDTGYWEILSDSEIEVFEQIADRAAEAWEETVDGLAREQEPPPPPPLALLTTSVRKLIASHSARQQSAEASDRFAITWCVFRDRYPHLDSGRIYQLVARRAS